MKRFLLLLVASIVVACAAPTAPPAPSKIPAKALKAPSQASFGRYILISGVWVWCETCEEGGS